MKVKILSKQAIVAALLLAQAHSIRLRGADDPDEKTLAAIEEAVMAETKQLAVEEMQNKEGQTPEDEDHSMVDISTQSSAAAETTIETKSGGDELDNLMDKYDKEEANQKYLQSKEYKDKIKKNEEQKLEAEKKTVEELE